MIKNILTLAFFILCFSGLAQVPAKLDRELVEDRRAILGRIQTDSRQSVLSAQEKKRLSKEFGFPLFLSLDHQRLASFQYMDGAGKPIYYTTYNANAAQTTGASDLQEGGELNLNLTGRGMVVGIYDQTRPKASHREFGNRVTQIDGSTEIVSVHSTHVTGTILAQGLNVNARGMANEATGWAFNWDGDVSKMIQNAYDPDLKLNGHLISNHSYGNLVGWYQHSNGNWAWAGNESVSNKEDYRFGFYTSKSQQIDDLAFAKPYYTIVWAAGNDRADAGDGTRNPDGPEDSIGPEGVPKNNLTIGAVNEVRDYKGPDDVVMSSFSSWGPVDDGRIKPDLVAMGVNVFSTAISNEDQSDSYTTLSGTSMAAPNATGSLFLLQELYHDRNAARYMRAATLKGLAIHTAKETGLSLGPDYRFGWGLLDVKAAADFIINENGNSKMIRELVLDNNQVYEYEFVSDGLSPVKATISWTDPAGIPPAPSVDPNDLMLVNDLDLRIIDEDGKVYYPWTLNPREGATARALSNADNFRDNVEQVVIAAPQSKKYTLRITHKGTLKHNLQAFSLVFNAGTSDGQDETLYWIGGEGDWNSPDNWSLESNGPGAGTVPHSGTRVVFDQTASSISRVNLTKDAEVFSLNFFGNSTVELNLNSNEIAVNGGLRVSNLITSISNGSLAFDGEGSSGHVIDMGNTIFDKVDMAINSGDWRIVSAGVLDRLSISGSQVELDVPLLQVDELVLNTGAVLSGRVQELVFGANVLIDEGASLNIFPTFRFIGITGSFTDAGKNTISSLVNEGQRLEVRQSGDVNHLGLFSGETLLIQANTTVQILEMKQGVVLNLMESNQINVTENISHEDASGNASLIKAAKKGIFNLEVYKKYCFNNLSVENVDLSGEALVNLGSNASIINSDNWERLKCSEVLFVNFEAAFTCEGASVEFINTTEGPATRYEWKFGFLGSSATKNPSFVFPTKGAYEVTLTAVSAGRSEVYRKTITIGENVLKKPSIVANGTMLTSLVPAPAYQWYKDGKRIDMAVERSYQAGDEGAYQVAVVNESCNRISDAVVISGMPDKFPLAAYGYFIGPNPASDFLRVRLNNDYLGEMTFEFYGMNGSLLSTFTSQKNDTEFVRDLRLNFQPGLYVLLLKSGDWVLPYRLIVQ